ncbi:MAG: DUF1983 domain-containing protein [Enterobacter sp.]|jgi:hypothetical protein|nr:DUF1983 domain-containing protein [Enterobacter sp.]
MGQKIITLSGAATDVLYALFFRGALQSGDLPAKSGAAELRELGFAETRHTATEYQKENYFTFLTAEGQEFAIKHLVNMRFGVPAGGYIGSPVDKPGGYIRCCCPIEGIGWGWFVDKSGQAYIHKALIGDGVLSTSYNVKLNVADKGKKHAASMTVAVEGDQSKVVFKADRFAVVQNAESVIRNAIENVRQSRVFEQLLEASQAQQAEALTAAVKDEIVRQCQPGGLLWRATR